MVHRSLDIEFFFSEEPFGIQRKKIPAYLEHGAINKTHFAEAVTNTPLVFISFCFIFSNWRYRSRVVHVNLDRVSHGFSSRIIVICLHARKSSTQTRTSDRILSQLIQRNFTFSQEKWSAVGNRIKHTLQTNNRIHCVDRIFFITNGQILCYVWADQTCASHMAIQLNFCDMSPNIVAFFHGVYVNIKSMLKQTEIIGVFNDANFIFLSTGVLLFVILFQNLRYFFCFVVTSAAIAIDRFFWFFFFFDLFLFVRGINRFLFIFVILLFGLFIIFLLGLIRWGGCILRGRLNTI